MIADRIKNFKRVKVTDLIDNPRNWRKHPDAQRNALGGLLESVGWADAVLARETPDGLMLIDGHLRKELADDSKIPVLVLDVTEAEADLILATHDPLTSMAETDQALLDELVQGLDIDNDETQKMLDELASDPVLEVVEDEVPEVPEEPTTKLGDLFALGDHRLLCGDSTSAEDVARLMDGAKASLCFTSPPYSDMRDYNGGDMSVEHLAMFIGVAAECCSLFCVNLGIARKDGAVLRYWDEYIEAAEKQGLRLVSWNVWDKGECGSIGNQSAMFGICHEWIFVFSDTVKRINRTAVNKRAGKWANDTSNRQQDGTIKQSKDVTVLPFRNMDTVTRISPAKDRNVLGNHPARYPITLPAEYVKACSDAGDVILDPFLGSGTTLIAAEQLGRKCYGMEISPAYCDVIIQRWENLTGNKARKV